jgi:hypothetical protein
MKRSKPEKPESSTTTPEPPPMGWTLGPDPFGQLGLSESEREKLAGVGRLASLASEPKASAFFIRLGSDSVSPKETKPSAQLDRTAP